MAQTFCTGPIHVAFGYGGTVSASGSTPTTTAYYGTTRTGPDIQEEPSYFNVMNDLAGPNLPFDRGYAGVEHTITLQMTRWDGNVDLSFDNLPVPVLGGAPAATVVGAGTEAANARGSMVSKITRLQVLMLYSNGPIVAPLDGAMLSWRRYFQAVNLGPNKPIIGNKENIRVRVFKMQNVFIGVNVANLNLPAMRLFDEGVGTVPFSFIVI